ncbi:hypothetical protein ABIE26_002977 [Pedobacter africanus]|uniref:hypothetical protein n=1 Tax=Pedobacter africanus TaxID=151894 RepID=UPI003395BBE7
METIFGLRHLQLYGIVLITLSLVICYLTGRMVYYFRLKAAYRPPRYLVAILMCALSWVLFFTARLILVAALLLLLMDWLAFL